MESKRRNQVYIDVEKEAFAPEPAPKYNYSWVTLRSRIAARVILKGSVSGATYEWPWAGSQVAVDSRDAPDLLEKKLGDRSCCGAEGGNKIFEIV